MITIRRFHCNSYPMRKSFVPRLQSTENVYNPTTSVKWRFHNSLLQIEPGGTSELEHGFHQAFDLLQSNQRTACQSIVVFVTDGKDTDGESVRCGPGYYTRSGYVPGPVCKYNWTKVWSALDDRNERANPRARVFSYLIKDDGEIFPGESRNYLQWLFLLYFIEISHAVNYMYTCAVCMTIFKDNNKKFKELRVNFFWR